MPTIDPSDELRRAAIARRVSNETRNPGDREALLQMAEELEAEADRLEDDSATAG